MTFGNGGGPDPSIYVLLYMLYVPAVVEDAEDFHYGCFVVHGIEDVVVLVSCPSHLSGPPRFAGPHWIAARHDVKTEYDLVDAVCEVGGRLRILKVKRDVAAGVIYVCNGLRRQLRRVFHNATLPISSV